MQQPLYIVGSALASALDLQTPDSLPSPDRIQRPLLDQVLDIPFRTIAGHSLYNNEHRMQQITRQVLQAAIADAGWGDAELQHCAVFIGSTSYSLYASELLYQKAAEQQPPPAIPGLTPFSMLPDFIQQQLPQAQLYTFNTACTSSANAMIYAGKMIRSGQIQQALVIGLEFYNDITLLGFHSLGLISKSAQMQPFGLNRDGLVLGEACSAVALSADKPAGNRHLQFVGGATLGDIYSMTAANPDGSSIEQVIRKALQQSGLRPDDIRGIKLHGTASLANDDAEFAGLTRIYGQQLPPVCALKPALGHTLGACGSNELVLLGHYLQQDRWPAAPAYPMDPKLAVGLDQPTAAVDDGHFLLNYFGFGGSNTTLIIRKST